MTRTISWSDAKQVALTEAVAVLEAGGVIGLPTETVYGLAAKNGDAGASKLREIKGRAEVKPFTLAVGSVAAARQLPIKFPSSADKLSRRFWPGPLTMVLERSDLRGESLGVRVPGSPVALELLNAFGAPVWLTSLNRAGEAPALRVEQVSEAMRERIDLLIDAGESPIKEPSTVVRFWPVGLSVERQGILTRDIVLKHATHHVLFVCSGNTCRSPMAAGLLRKLIAAKLGVPERQLRSHGVVIDSAGVAAHDGADATSEAVRVAEERGADLSEHSSRGVDEEMVARADLILAMTSQHLQELEGRFPAHAARMELLDRNGRDVVDPIGGTIADYRRCADQIEHALEQCLVLWGFDR